MTVFQKFLIEEMSKRKLSQRALHIYSNGIVSQSTLSSWLSGVSPSVDRAEELLDYLGYEFKIEKKVNNE